MDHCVVSNLVYYRSKSTSQKNANTKQASARNSNSYHGKRQFIQAVNGEEKTDTACNFTTSKCTAFIYYQVTNYILNSARHTPTCHV